METQCPADLNGDGSVSTADLLEFLADLATLADSESRLKKHKEGRPRGAFLSSAAMIWIKWFLSVLGGLGVFLFGMRTLVTPSVARPPRHSGNSCPASPRARVGTVTGFFVTSLIQSSSAVTVTLVSLVNAGLLTIRESVGVLLGTNVGTTITAWLMVLSLGGLSLSDLALPLAGLAVPLLLLDRRVPKQIADIVFGFALLFIGLDLLKDQMAVLGAQELFATLLPNLGEGLGSNVLFLLLGAGADGLDSIFFRGHCIDPGRPCVEGHQLGACIGHGARGNIGTTLTANLAAVVGNRAGKRVARIHFLINALGSVWMVGLIPLLAEGLSGVFAGVDDPAVRSGYVMASFHTTFNVFNGLLMSLLSENLVSLSKNSSGPPRPKGGGLVGGHLHGKDCGCKVDHGGGSGDFRRSGGTLKEWSQASKNCWALWTRENAPTC